MEAAKEKHDRLYSAIPTFSCKPGCIDCCGVIVFSRWEWERVSDKRKATTIQCPYAREGYGCEIYDNRPFICRLFGAADVPELTCPHGCGPVKKLTPDEAYALTQEYLDLVMVEGRHRHE